MPHKINPANEGQFTLPSTRISRLKEQSPSQVRSCLLTHNLDLNLIGLVIATEPNSSMQSHDPLLIPASPAVSRGYLGPNNCSVETRGSSSSAEDVDGDIFPVTECLGQSYPRRHPNLVQQLSGSFTRAFKLGRNRKSLEITNST